MRYFNNIHGENNMVNMEIQIYGELWASTIQYMKKFVDLVERKQLYEAQTEISNIFKMHDISCLRYLDGAFILKFEVAGVLYIYKSLLCKSSLYYKFENAQIKWSTNALDLLCNSKTIQENLNNNIVLLSCLGESVQAQQSCYKDIYRIPAGHIIIYQNYSLKIKKIDFLEPKYQNLSISEYSFLIRDVLNNTIERRKHSFGNVGVLLSGGMDSSVILYVLKNAGVQVEAFHWDCSGIMPADESAYAKTVASYLGVPLHNIPSTPIIKSNSFINPNWDFHVPYNHSFYKLFEATRIECENNNIDTLASGYLGDIVFGYLSGYEQIDFLSLLKNLSFVEALKYTREKRSTIWNNFQLDNLNFPRSMWYESYLTCNAKEVIKQHHLCPHNAKSKEEFLMEFSDNETDSVLESHLFSKYHMNMVYIFLSRELLELSISLPSCYKIMPIGGQWIDKAIMRLAFIDCLPREIIARNHRQLMTAINEEYAINNRQQIKELLLNKNTIISDFDIIDIKKLSKILASDMLTAQVAPGLVCCCMTELWLRSISNTLN